MYVAKVFKDGLGWCLNFESGSSFGVDREPVLSAPPLQKNKGALLDAESTLTRQCQHVDIRLLIFHNCMKYISILY